MTLTLEVVGKKAAQMGGAARKVFASSGTIGRLRSNDWVFPQEYISGRHAKIVFSNGSYFIEDTSTNGVFLQSPQNRLIRGQLYELHDGDTLYIDDFEVRVSLAGEPAAAKTGAPVSAPAPSVRPVAHRALAPKDPFSGDSGGSGNGGIPGGISGDGGMPGGISGDGGMPGASVGETDPLKLLGIQSPRLAPTGPKAAGLDAKSPLSQHYRPPAARQPTPLPIIPEAAAPELEPPAASLIPEDYDPFAPDESLLLQKPPKRPAAAPGMNPARVSPAAARPLHPDNAPSRARWAPPGADRRAVPRSISSAAANARPAVRTASEPSPIEPSPAITLAAGAPPAAVRSRTKAVPASYAETPDPAGSSASLGLGPPDAGAARSGASRSGNLDVAALLAGAGIDSTRVTPELSRQFGQILRVVVSGLMDVLHARDQIKDEFRMRMTSFKATDNNPLKFSANVEDALHNLLVKRNAAYLGPVEAFEDAFADLRNHQMAILAGLRVAYESMLSEFDPGSLQEQFDREVKSGSFLSGSVKQKYWDLYRARFHDMVKDADGSFRTLFGDEFAKAYEEQLIRLRKVNPADRQ